MVRAAAGVAGRVLVGLGVVLLLFTAFGLWGTGIFEAHSQAGLRGELAEMLPSGAIERAARIAARPTPKATPGPPTTAPPAAAPL
ncbi:MAG TPA: hypothetical protein VGG23_06930, partial [Acidimicrobiales bacterium]